FASSPRGAFDTSDFFATVIRRVDAVLGHRVQDAGSHGAPGRGVGGMESPAGILGRIMRDAAADYARSVHAERRVGGGGGGGGVPARAGFGSVGELDEGLVSGSVVRAVVSKLDATDGQIFRLRALGVEHGVVGDTLGMTEGAVRMRWHRIVDRLQR